MKVEVSGDPESSRGDEANHSATAASSGSGAAADGGELGELSSGPTRAVPPARSRPARVALAVQSRRLFLSGAAILTICFFAWQCVWAVLTPAFRGPDEVQHFNSVLRVATTGQWPDPGEAKIDPDVLRAVHEAGFMAGSDDFFALANKTPLRDGLGEGDGFATAYEKATIKPYGERLIIDYGSQGESEYVDQMTQHPALYYQLSAGALKVVDATDWSWDRQLLLLRLFSAFLTIPLVPSLIYTARRVGISRLGSLVVGGTVFLIPQVAFATSVVTNDALAIGAGALTIASCAAAMWGRGTYKNVLCCAVFLGLGLWSKGTFIPMGLVVGLSFLLNSNIPTWRQRWARGISAGALGVAIGGFWWIRNLVVYGSLQPAGMEREVVAQGSDASRYIRQVFRLFVDSSWGQFGWLEWWLNPVVIGVLATCLALALIVGVARGPDRAKRLNLIVFYLSVGAMLMVQAWSAFQEAGYVSGIQGRYLFPGLVGVLAVAGAAWLPEFERVAARGPGLLLGLPGLVAGAVSLYAFLAWAQACYYNPEDFASIDWQRWSDAAGWSTSTLQAVSIVGCCALVISLCVPWLTYVLSKRSPDSKAVREVMEPANSPVR
ncbi:DUF2142 domain-containing protein [Actinomycetaceae bacterium L2_0104]